MISQEFIQTVGWTLIHSLWQGLLIYLTFKIVGRFTGSAEVRYSVGVAALAILLICSLVTLFILNSKTTSDPYRLVINASQTSTAAQSWSALEFINQNIIWLIRFWMLGFVVGLLRIAAGLFYINRLRRNSYAVQDEWMEMVTRLSETLNINRVVEIAEAHISSPMVVGFMKPIILFPIGLLSGLSAEQVETILVHELSHIRRQDYIINLCQSVIETIFFFNPFVLLMSSAIREERENCCDDMVIAKGISPISYVKTLAQLEAARSSSKLALGFAGNENQLLNRIKRIMENSAKNDWGKGRFVPVILLFLGLVCASWLSISSEKEMQAKPVHTAVAKDTSREDGLVIIKRGRTHDSWHMMEAPPEPFEPIEAIPSIEAIPPVDAIPSVDAIPPVDEMPPIPSFPDLEFAFAIDSIPGMYFKMRDTEEWSEFEREFTEKFKEQFKDFYDKNQSEFERLIEDVKRDEARRHRDAEEVVDLADMLKHQGEQASLQAIQAQQQMIQFEKMQMRAMSLKDQARIHQEIARDMQERAEAYNAELLQMLIDDGYITKGEASNNNINIADNGNDLQINGHDIKEKDRVKYRALHDKYFKSNMRRTYGRSE